MTDLEDALLSHQGARLYRSADISHNETSSTEFMVNIPAGAINGKIVIKYRTETEENDYFTPIFMGLKTPHLQDV